MNRKVILWIAGCGWPCVTQDGASSVNPWWNWTCSPESCLNPCLFSVRSHPPEWQTILASGSSTWTGELVVGAAAAELLFGKGKFRVCQIQLQHRLHTEPIAKQFLIDLLTKSGRIKR